MAITNYERVGKAMELLKAGLAPFRRAGVQEPLQGQALVEAQRFITSDGSMPTDRSLPGTLRCSRLMWDAWNDVFRKTLGQAERSLVSELRDVRNKWAHQEPFQ